MSTHPTRASAAEPALKEPLPGKGAIASFGVELSNAVLRALIDTFPDQLYARDRQHRHILNNHAQVKLLGAKNAEETLGKTDYDFYPEEIAEDFHRDNEKVMSTGEALVGHEEYIPMAGGKGRWLSTTKVSIRGSTGEIVGLLGVAFDITERKEATDKITEQAAMIEQAHDAIVLLDLEGRVLYKNPAAERIFGVQRARAEGRNAAEIFSALESEQFVKAARETLEKGTWHGEFRIHKPDGTEVIIENRRSIIRDADGKPKAQLSISVDITDQKRVEALSLRNQRLESIGTLAGGIAHDLNNVLAPILMSIALLRHKVGDEGGQRLLGMLEQNAERGAQLVRQVLAFGRGIEGEKALIQIKHIAREVGQIIADTFPKNIRFSLEGESRPWAVIGDATQLHQVLLNLCVNARDAMPSGGNLTLRILNRYLDETFASMNPGSRPGPYVIVSVIDTGTGMPAVVRDRIFEPFFTTKEVGKGTGLGLSTSMGIVQGHGGFLTVESEVGKGTTFNVYLPANAETQAEAAPVKVQEDAPRGSGELLLVIDDEDPILEVAKSTLEKYGYRVLTAPHGAAAVSLFAVHHATIAAVITDMAMPIMDGPSTAAALRAIRPDVPIIGSSGLDSATSPANRVRTVFADFIQKPYTAEALLSSVATVIRKASASQAE
jgi:PAS domain S-box-containing protein